MIRNNIDKDTFYCIAMLYSYTSLYSPLYAITAGGLSVGNTTVYEKENNIYHQLMIDVSVTNDIIYITGVNNDIDISDDNYFNAYVFVLKAEQINSALEYNTSFLSKSILQDLQSIDSYDEMYDLLENKNDGIINFDKYNIQLKSIPIKIDYNWIFDTVNNLDYHKLFTDTYDKLNYIAIHDIYKILSTTKEINTDFCKEKDNNTKDNSTMLEALTKIPSICIQRYNSDGGNIYELSESFFDGYNKIGYFITKYNIKKNKASIVHLPIMSNLENYCTTLKYTILGIFSDSIKKPIELDDNGFFIISEKLLKVKLGGHIIKSKIVDF